MSRNTVEDPDWLYPIASSVESPVERCLPWTDERTNTWTPPFPLLQFVGPVQYLTTEEQTDAWCSCLMGPMTVGFDTEWKPTYVKGEPPNKTALIQLCCRIHQDPVCLLIHIYYCGISYELKRVLASTDIIKVGMAAHGDAEKLRMGYGVEVQGIIDLAQVVREKDLSDCIDPNVQYTKNEQSLLGLTERLLGCSMSKQKKIRCGNWECFPLKINQQRYAANDAYASLLCYEVLIQLPPKQHKTRHQPQSIAAPHPLAQMSTTDSLSYHTVRDVHHPLGSVDSVDYVPAFSYQKGLSEEARSAYHLFMGVEHLHLPKRTLTDVAAQLRRSVEHVCELLADAILAGYAYDWNRIMIPMKITERLAAALLQCLAQGQGIPMPYVEWGHPLATSMPMTPSLESSIDRLTSVIRQKQLIQKATGVIDFRTILAGNGVDSEAIMLSTDDVISHGSRRVAMAHIGRLISDSLLKQTM